MAWPVQAPHGSRPGLGAAFVWALLSAVSFGVGFWVQGRFAVPRLGAFLPVWLYYAAGVPTMLLVLGRRSLPLPLRGDWPVLAGIGLSGAGAYIAFCAGLQTGALAVVAVLHERLAAHQWPSVAVILLGLMLLNGR
jgi:drug/metabolite transporter (DMT)-like permease